MKKINSKNIYSLGCLFKKEKTERQTPANERIFYKAILSRLRENISKYEQSDRVEWNLDMGFVYKFNMFQLSDVDAIKATHTQIFEQETMATN